MMQIQSIVPKIKELGPFDLAYSSRLCRGNDVNSILCMALNMDWRTSRLLGQHASRQSGKTYFYPQCEKEWYDYWQKNAILFVTNNLRMSHLSQDMSGEVKVLIGTHRPIVAGLIGWARGVTNTEMLKGWARSEEMWKDLIHIFRYNPNAGVFEYLND
ncbi:MAG: hypothetical protein WC575_00470 [Patescibacteria group bacterium]